MSEFYTRRQFLHGVLVGGLGLTGLFLAACGSGTSSATATETTGTSSAPTTAATPQSTVAAESTEAATPSTPAMSDMTMPPMASAMSSPMTEATAIPSESAAPAPTSSGSNAPAPATVKIVEPSLNYQTWTYQPDDLKVPVGTTVTWTNTGGAAHTVTADDGKSFDSGPIQAGKTFSMTMATAGSFPYHCTFHPWMKGTITVTA